MIPLPSLPKIVEKKGNDAVFEIEGLYPGYGATIGNCLRRVLLSSLPGAAITQMKIKGVQHEFSTIPNVFEDVITIMLNLKQLRFKLYGDEPQKAILSVKGAKEVKGSDFELPSQLELMNKDTHIATLTDKKASLEIEVRVEKGLGYVPVEMRKKEKLEIGEMPVDAIYTPVRKVRYKSENMRVGERTDYDKIILEVETDGTVTPEEAFSQASEILFKHFSLFGEAFKEVEETRGVPGEESGEEGETTEAGKVKVEDLKLSTRTLNALAKNNIKTVGGLSRKSDESLLELEGMGEKGVKEIKKALKKLGIEIKSEK